MFCYNSVKQNICLGAMHMDDTSGERLQRDLGLQR